MPVKYVDEWPKKKAPVFNEIEVKRLVALYCESYDLYHGKLKSGGKNVVSEKQRLLKEWSKEISSMGFATRTKDQIEEKIRNEVKKVQKHLKHVKTERMKRKSSANAKAHLAKLPSYLHPLVDLISHRRPEYDVTGAAEQLLTAAQEKNRSSENIGDNETSGPLENTGCLFDDDRKPTREELRELRNKLGLDSTVVLEDPSTACNMQGTSFEQGDSTTQNITGLEETPRSTRMDRELHCSLTTQRLKLYEEKTKLTKMKQDEVAIRLEEAKISLQLRLIELERAKLEMERVRGVVAERDSPAPTPPTSTKTNGA